MMGGDGLAVMMICQSKNLGERGFKKKGYDKVSGVEFLFYVGFCK